MAGERMKALRPFSYAGKRLAVGEEFETKGKMDGKLLTAAGRAVSTKKVEAKEAKKRGRTMRVASMTPAPQPEPVPTPQLPVEPVAVEQTKEDEEVVVDHSRYYERRDMKAEGE